MKLDYFYGAQMERLLKHLIRMFSNFKVMEGYDDEGKPMYRAVPCRHGDISRLAATILSGNSENTIPTAPFMTVSFTNMTLKKDAIRSPMSEQLVATTNKKGADGTYTDEVDAHYEIERYNPIPWKVDFDVDMYVTNNINKMELFEQIATLFAPSVPLQLSVNPNDWTSYGHVDLVSYTMNSGRSFPQGAGTDLDIAKFKFETTIWLSLPAKVNRAVLINQVVADVRVGTLDDFNLPTVFDTPHLRYEVYTPGNHSIKVRPASKENEYIVTLLGKNGGERVGSLVYDWKKLFQYYTDNSASVNTLSLLSNITSGTSIRGTVALTDIPNEILYTVDPQTYPKETGTFEGFITAKTIENTTMNIVIVKGDIDGYEDGDILLKAGASWIVNKPMNGEIRMDTQTKKRYKYTKGTGWGGIVDSKYYPGLWRLGFPL